VTTIRLMHADQIRLHQDEWLARRRKWTHGWVITASEMPKILGIAPRSHGGPYKLWWDKKRGEETGDRDEMRRGRALEPIVLEEFAESHEGLVLLPGGMYCQAEHPWLAATLDGQAIERDTAMAFDNRWGQIPEDEWMVVEAKTSIPMDEWGWEEDTNEIPDHIRAQVLTQAYCRGARRAFVAVKPIATWAPTRTYVIEIDGQAEAEIAWMIEQAAKFRELLDSDKPPPVDWYPDTTEELRRRHPGSAIDPELTARIPWALARRYRALAYAKDKLDRRKGLVTNQVLERAGDAGQIVTVDPRTGREIPVASRTSGPVPEIKIPARENVTRLNRRGWAKVSKEKKETGS